MAKEKKNDQKKPGIVGKIIKGVIAFLVVILVLCVILGALIKFDVASIGTKYATPLLKDIPVISKILPEQKIDEEAIKAITEKKEANNGEETALDTSVYQNLEQAVQIIALTEEKLKKTEKKVDILNEQINQLGSENKRLKVFEDNFSQLESDKKVFDEKIAAGLPASEYAAWYEKINPNNAANIYSKTIKSLEKQNELDELVKTYNDMKPASAAAILEKMATTRLEMVTEIIKSLNSKQAADILSSMKASTAARITAYLYPVE